MLHMARPADPSDEDVKRHFIVEWADYRGVTQADIVRGIEVDKGTVSRWFSGLNISKKHAMSLAMFLQAGEVAGLYRHPMDDWVARFMRDLSNSERVRAKELLELAFPRRAA